MEKHQILTSAEKKNIYCDDIRKYRDEKCYPQDYMASLLGITQSAYYKIEAGAVKISTERLAQIAKILGKPIEAFLQKEQYNEQLKSEQKVYINLNELELLQKTITQQQNRIEELKAKLKKRDDEIEKLKQQIIV
ncbi:helix-turn-helix domain-containing protein [Pedobacter frigiditerrae]|uniref:Helix-turn-helix domain-containing protein n=1 Tax=Pedobacter frigiditerrae TaxID=2530452 RepID=A0A4R0N6S5_9SPHI|nr:helix-turn-helix transcriptional regulator [Pedobacter frigiditerrae]TCC94372.1 helix-turn-helix domain-containing protein [Pedobacter frigiditerrae]